MAALHRAAFRGMRLLGGRLPAAAGEQPLGGNSSSSSRSFCTLGLGGLWQQQGSAVAAAAAAAQPSALAGAWRRVAALIPSSLADSLLMAVPKKKVSPHRKGKRSATKFIRFVPVVSQCSQCKRVFAQHSVPSKCEEEECPAFSLRARPAATPEASD